MSGGSKPGEVIVFKVKGVHSKDILIEVISGKVEYLIKDQVYVATVTPKSE
jgi:hypothetical protein